MTNQEIKDELKLREVKFGGNTGKEKLLELLNEDRAKKGESPITDNEDESTGKNQEIGDKVEVEMVCNIKHGDTDHEPQNYLKGQKYILDEDVADFFKTNGWAK